MAPTTPAAARSRVWRRRRRGALRATPGCRGGLACPRVVLVRGIAIRSSHRRPNARASADGHRGRAADVRAGRGGDEVGIQRRPRDAPAPAPVRRRSNPCLLPAVDTALSDRGSAVRGTVPLHSLALRQRTTSFTGIAGAAQGNWVLTGSGVRSSYPARPHEQRVHVLQARAAIGRTFGVNEESGPASVSSFFSTACGGAVLVRTRRSSGAGSNCRAGDAR